jgi:hypothetical protein
MYYVSLVTSGLEWRRRLWASHGMAQGEKDSIANVTERSGELFVPIIRSSSVLCWETRHGGKSCDGREVFDDGDTWTGKRTWQNITH